MQRYCALHAVEPNWDSNCVFSDAQRGHGTTTWARRSGLMPETSTRPPITCGGAMPKPLSRVLASGAIQSVLHGGESWLISDTSVTPMTASVSRISALIISVAGQPE